MWKTGSVRGSVILENITGTYGYVAGASGTVIMPAGCKILGMSVYASGAGATITINGGASIPVPTGGVVDSEPWGNLTSPTYVFTGTTAYFVEYVF